MQNTPSAKLDMIHAFPGFDAADAARIFHKLMTRLGHATYYVQGGDWGALISRVISQSYPE